MSTGQDAILRIGIAGLGQAAAMLLPALESDARVVVTAIADRRVAARDALATSSAAIETYDTVGGLFESGGVDLVYIATPTHLHAEHAIAALRAGKHVIVEKPMAVTLEDALAMVAAAQECGRHLIVGHSQSFEPPIRAMREVVTSGQIGRLRMMHTWSFTDWLYRPRLPGELDRALGGGAMFRQGAHQVDILRWIGGGLVRSVRAAVGDWDVARPGDGSHTLFLDFEDGTVATAVYSGYDHFHSRELMSGIGEDGRDAAGGPYGAARRASQAFSEAERKAALGAPAGRGAAPSSASAFGLTLVSCERGDIRQTPAGLAIYGDDELRHLSIPVAPSGRALLIDEAFGAVHGGQRPAHDGRWGLANLEVCLAAIESATARQEVRLHHQVPTPDQ